MVIKDPTPQERAFYDDLVAARLVIPTGVPGVFGRGTVFEDVLERFNQLVTALAANDGAERMLFPPTLSRRVFEKSEFLNSFPQLAGSIWSFEGNDTQHHELMQRVHDGKPWGDLQVMTDVVLSPAACYPVYPTMAGTLPEGGRLVDMLEWVFRHEPSHEPTRMQCFRVREFVRVGTQDMVVGWRNAWLQRGHELLMSLGLAARPEVASDPFFGRGGRMLAASQKEMQLKFEIVVPVCSEEKPTAVCSFNYHQEHFGKIFGIQTAAGATAQTACLGFGLERVVLALFKTHGVDTAQWQASVKRRLWP
jgi:seryl-tRNA synthetase